MPEAVETSGYAGDRSHERVGHPDGEDSVLLPEGLSRGDAASVFRSDSPSDPKLNDAADKGNCCHACHIADRNAAFHNRAGRHYNRKWKRNRPKVECEVIEMQNPAMKTRQEKTHEPCADTRHYEQGKSLRHNHAECCRERDSGGRVHERHDCGDYDCRDNVDEYGVGDDSRHVSSKLAGDYRRCRRRRAYHTNHKTFDEQTAVPSSAEYQHYARNDKTCRLNQQ